MEITESHKQLTVLTLNPNCLYKMCSIANLFNTNVRNFHAKNTTKFFAQNA